jgi:hypothetical protein
MAMRKWRKTEQVVFSDAFSLLLSFGMEKKVRRSKGIGRYQKENLTLVV